MESVTLTVTVVVCREYSMQLVYVLLSSCSRNGSIGISELFHFWM